MEPVKQSEPRMTEPVPAPAGPEAPQKARKHTCMSITKIIVAAVLAALMLIFNIIFLAGVGASQARCKDTGVVPVTARRSLLQVDTSNVIQDAIDATNQQVAAGGTGFVAGFGLSTEEACRVEYSLHWWVVFFQLICTLLAILTTAVPFLKQELNTGLTAWFAINTTLLMYLASVYSKKIWSLKEFDGDTSMKNAIGCAMAGAVVLCIVNLLYMMLSSSSVAPSTTSPARSTPPPIQEVPVQAEYVAYTVPPLTQPQEVPAGTVPHYNMQQGPVGAYTAAP